MRRGHVPVLQPSTVTHPCPERTDDQDLSKPGAANRKVTIIKSGVQKPAVRLQDVASGQQKCTKPDRQRGGPGQLRRLNPAGLACRGPPTDRWGPCRKPDPLPRPGRNRKDVNSQKVTLACSAGHTTLQRVVAWMTPTAEGVPESAQPPAPRLHRGQDAGLRERLTVHGYPARGHQGGGHRAPQRVSTRPGGLRAPTGKEGRNEQTNRAPALPPGTPLLTKVSSRARFPQPFDIYENEKKASIPFSCYFYCSLPASGY